MAKRSRTTDFSSLMNGTGAANLVRLTSSELVNEEPVLSDTEFEAALAVKPDSASPVELDGTPVFLTEQGAAVFVEPTPGDELRTARQRVTEMTKRIAELEAALSVQGGGVQPLYDHKRELAIEASAAQREARMSVNRSIVAHQQNVRFTPSAAKHLGVFTVELAEATGYEFSVTDLANICAEVVWEYRKGTPGFLCRLHEAWSGPPPFNSREEQKNWARRTLLDFIASCRQG